MGFVTPPRNRGGIMFSLQFVFLYVCVCMYVCVSVCTSVCFFLLVNKIPAERKHQFGRGFHSMFAYCTGSDRIEIDDLGSKVKVKVT